MPELKRNFDKGKMNKDLDERLLPPGEYKDAVNIEVTTSDGSNMGVVENIKGNTKISNISFKEPFYDGEPIQSAHPSSGLPDFYGTNTPNAAITSFSSNAEVVGSVVDDKTKKLYGFVARALDFSTVTQGTSNLAVQTGVRSDAIFEFDTNKDDSGNYPLNEYVFVDAYQSRWNWGVIKPGKVITNNAPDVSGSEADQSDGYSEVRITGSDYFNQTNGIEKDMVVKAVKPDGTNIWENLGTIQVVSAGPVGGLADGTANHVRLTLTGGEITAANINDGVVLEFTRKDRFLNFDPSTKYNYTDTEGSTRSSATPEDNKITGVNLFDGLLYFTDGTTEPKKLNIERCKKGTLNSLYETTRLVYNRFDGQTVKEDLKISDVTVMKRAPLNAPTLVMRNTGLVGEVSKIGIQPIDLSNIDNNGLVDLNIDINVEGNLVVPNGLQTSAIGQDERRSIDTGDVIMLQNSGYEARLKVVDYAGGTIVGSVIKCELIECNVSYLESCDNPLISWEARLESSSLPDKHPQKAMFEDEFTRIAYRWRYIDGEVSAISPFSKPAFIPRGTYSFSSKEGYNNAMVNDLRELTVEGFLPYPYCSREVVQVDILAKQDGVNNIKLLKSVKLNDFDAEEGYAFDKFLSVGSLDQKRGSVVFTGATFGSTLPSNQLLRPFDAVPRSAVAQTVSASRLIYGNYKDGYDLTDAQGNNVDIKFHYSWDNNRKAVHFKDWNAYGVTRHIGQFYGYESLKNGRTYSFGMVYRDGLGRESSVLLGDNSTHTCPYSLRDKPIKAEINVDHRPPTWAKSFKFFVKESSDEYYNICLFANFPATLDEDGNAGETWLVFSSVDRNKVAEGDILIIKKAHSKANGSGLGQSQASISNTMNKEYKILDISNEVPDDSIPTAIAETITGELKAGKFFVKVKLDRPLINAFGINPGDANWRLAFVDGVEGWFFSGGNGANSHNPLVFEVKPKENQDLDIYYEIPKAYPVSLDQENTSSWIDVGDRVGIYYKVGANFELGGNTPEDFFEITGGSQTSRRHYYNLKRSVARLIPPRHEGGHAIIRLDQAVTLGNTSNENNPGNIFITKSDGSSVRASIKYRDSYSGPSTDIYIKTGKESIHSGSYTLPFSNCFNFTNGVESNRIRDDFNAPTMKNGVKVSVTSSNYKEQQREHGLIFSGIYNSKNGVNNLNEFISSSGIKKDLNPQFGSIQILNARDTNITTICEHKTVKILANKDALFTAGGGGQVTSTKNVLGQTVPYAGEFGIGNMRGSFASEEFRSYFIDPYRSKVLRLSNDGLTPISDAGMSDYFSDNLSSVVASHGQYNRDKGEYDLTIHYDLNKTAGTKKVETISYSEGVRGWTSKKSYIPENSISLDNTYFTFRGGDTYVHEEAATINNFYGIQHNSSITTIINGAPDLIKSFQTVGYEGSQAKIIQYQRNLDNEYNTAGGDQAYLDGAYSHDYDASPEGLVSGSNYYNNIARKGWFLESLTTDKQSGRIHEFLDKEGKWFNYIQGEETTFDNATNVGNIDTQELSVQGIGPVGSVGASYDFGNFSITTTAAVSGDGAANATVTGEVTSGIQNGTNTNTITTNNITITAAACFSFESDDISFGSMPPGVASVTVPGGQVVLPGESLVLTVVFSSATLSSNVSFNIPIVIAAMDDVCQDHEFNIRITTPADNTNYSFDGVLGLNDYDVYSPYLEVDTDYHVSGQSLLASITGINAQQTYSTTFTADSGYYIPTTTSFDPTNALNDASDWSNVKAYVYDDNGNITSVTYTWSYEGQANNPDPTDGGISAFDLFTYPSVAMISLTGEIPVEEPPALDDNVTITVQLVDSSGNQIANATTTPIVVEVLSDTNLNTINGSFLTIAANDGFDVGEASAYQLAAIVDPGVDSVTLTNGEDVPNFGIDNTIHVLPVFTDMVISEDTTINIVFTTTRVVALVTGHKWRLQVLNQSLLDASVDPAVTEGSGYSIIHTQQVANVSDNLDIFQLSKDAIGTTIATVATVVLVAKDDHQFTSYDGASIGQVQNVNDWALEYAVASHDGDADRKLTVTIKYTASTEYNNTYDPLDTVRISKYRIEPI